MKKIGNLIAGACMIAIGLFFFTNKINAMANLVLYIAIVLFIKAGFLLVSMLRNQDSRDIFTLIQIALDIAIGLILIFNMPPKTSFIPIVMGIWISGNGIIQIISSIRLKESGVKKWYIVSLIGLLLLIVGIAIIANPVGLVKFTALIIGITLIGYGSFFIYNGLKKSPAKKAKK